MRESGGAGVVAVELLIDDGRKHPKTAVPSGPVVEHLDPVLLGARSLSRILGLFNSARRPITLQPGNFAGF